MLEVVARDKYSLEPLMRVRKANVEAAAVSLARAETSRRGAEERRAEAEGAIAAAEASARSVREDARGTKPMTAEELAAVDAWEVREQKERAERSNRLKLALAHEADEKTREEKARSEAIKRQADAKVVENDRKRWQELQDRRKDSANEVLAEEGWAAGGWAKRND